MGLTGCDDEVLLNLLSHRALNEKMTGELTSFINYSRTAAGEQDTSNAQHAYLSDEGLYISKGETQPDHLLRTVSHWAGMNYDDQCDIFGDDGGGLQPVGGDCKRPGYKRQGRRLKNGTKACKRTTKRKAPPCNGNKKRTGPVGKSGYKACRAPTTKRCAAGKRHTGKLNERTGIKACQGLKKKKAPPCKRANYTRRGAVLKSGFKACKARKTKKATNTRGTGLSKLKHSTLVSKLRAANKKLAEYEVLGG